MNYISKKIKWRLFSPLFFLLIILMNSSCSEIDSLENSGFTLFYSGLTDIGPSMTFNLEAPTYFGGVPSDFKLDKVKLDGNVVAVNSFAIDGSSGAVSVFETNDLDIGLYTLTVSCKVKNKIYVFEDVVSVNMMRAVPEGITMTPDLLEVSLETLLDEALHEEIPTAQVVTDGDHVSIQKYNISTIRKNEQIVPNDGLFIISQEGLFTLNPNVERITPGKYILDLKLVTAASDLESPVEGLYTNAITVNITSKPLSLEYTPSNARIEFGSSGESFIPDFVGSEESLSFSITSVTPEDVSNNFAIDSKTGVISLVADNNIEVGTDCVISVRVENAFGSEMFEDVYSVFIVEYITPISEFDYGEGKEFSQAVEFSLSPNIIGDEVAYSFVGLDEKLLDLKIDQHTGEISTTKGNRIPIGNYTITIRAENIKSAKETNINLSIRKNPYLFTFFQWGNNLDLAPVSDYASQFRYHSANEFLNASISLSGHDIPEGIEVEWNVHTTSLQGGKNNINIDDDGTLTFEGGWQNAKAIVIIVEAITGKGLPEETRIKQPLFVHFSAETGGARVEYTPFVAQINPRTGGRSVVPEVITADPSKFLMDYRRNFQFYNINGPASHKNGQPGEAGNDSFMYSIWSSYYQAIASPSINTGARAPMSYIDNKNRTSVPAGYVNPADLSIVINPDKWKDDTAYANGVFIGQITFATNGLEGSVGGGTQIFPIAIWFDSKF